jgi:phage repressor protein C with HTH and peptisase S24 domain
MTTNYVVVSDSPQVLPSARFAELLTAVLNRGAPFRFQANGFSMFPFIRDGDVLTIMPKANRLRLGDVVVFVNPYNDRLTVHRVVGIDQNNYLIRGDNCPESDGTISYADILGCVTRVEHHGRRAWLGLGIERVVIAFLSQCGWLISLIVLIHYIFHFFIKRFIP